jgi:hypothetical protein
MKAQGILIDAKNFRHKNGPDIQAWRVKNISNRYSEAGVKRFAFLFPEGSLIPPMLNESAKEERFLTRAFTNMEQAVAWIVASEDTMRP